jgi:ATP-binding cassette subfamily B protein RaxB
MHCYGTLIGDMGTVLSGGQKQRVLLARALSPARNSHARRGDEPSRCRARAGGQPALRATHMTRIVIAHRPETIRASARVVSLENGAIVTDGPPPRALRLT